MMDKIFTLFCGVNANVAIIIFLAVLVLVGYILVKIQKVYLKKFWIEKELETVIISY